MSVSGRGSGFNGIGIGIRSSTPPDARREAMSDNESVEIGIARSKYERECSLIVQLDCDWGLGYMNVQHSWEAQ